MIEWIREQLEWARFSCLICGYEKRVYFKWRVDERMDKAVEIHRQFCRD